VSGEHADDLLYLPASQRVWASLACHGWLDIGDCKMAALETRALLAVHHDFYLCPLAATQMATAELTAYLQPVWAGQPALTAVYRELAEGKRRLIAEGFEQTLTLSAGVAGRMVEWDERRLIIRSLQPAQASETALRARLTQAMAALKQLNLRKRGKKRFTEVEPLRQAAEAVLNQYAVQAWVCLSDTEQVTQRPVRRYRHRPAMTREDRQATVTAEVDQAVVEAAVRRLGWRMYVANQPAAH
jgi:transposase